MAEAEGKKKDGNVHPLVSPKAAEVEVEFGVGPLIPGAIWETFGSLSGDDDSVTIANKPIVTIDQLVEMRRRDGQAKALIQLVTLPLRLALQTGEWIEPEGGDAEKEVEFANLMWTLPPVAGGMTTPQSKVVRQMLLSLTDGYAPFEEVRQVPKEGPLKGKITLRKLAYRDPRTVKFRVDKQGGYNGFRQTTQDAQGNVIDVVIPADKSVVITQHDELNPHYGVSLFESAYPHFDAKRKLYYIAHLAAQFSAVPGRVGEIAKGAKPAEIAAFRRALASFAFNTAMVVPNGYKVTPFSGNTGFDFLRLIDHHNSQMSKSVLASFFDNDQRTVLIENTTQDASADLFLLCLESIANDIAESLTHYVMPRYIDWNFGTKKYPVFRPGALSDSAKESIRELFKTVVTSSILNSTPEMVRELEKKVSEEMGLDIDYTEIEKREKEAAEQQAAAEAEQQELAGAEGEEPPGGAEGAPEGAEPPSGEGGPPPGLEAGPRADEEPVAASSSPFSDEEGVAAAASSIDALVIAAAELFKQSPESPESPVDDF